MILFVVALMAFGLPLSILDLNRGEDSTLVPSSYGFWPIDTLVNQYELSLGEFVSLEAIPENP